MLKSKIKNQVQKEMVPDCNHYGKLLLHTGNLKFKNTLKAPDIRLWTFDIKNRIFDPMEMDDTYFMQKTLQEAQMAFDKGEVPVGAVVVIENRIIARAHNLTELLKDVTAHAEMQAITSAAHFLGGKYLKNCTLYVTLEPCQMCAGALYWSQIQKIVFGAHDRERGFTALGAKLHPKTKIVGGILEKEAAALLKRFFIKKRNLN